MLVVGNAGMAGRTEFLLGNVPNRVSHAARCTVVIVNTTDGRVHEPPPEEHAEGGAARPRGADRTAADAAAGSTLRKTASPLERAQHLRAALEQLGPTFAKLGQILSTRPDLVPPEVVDELARLQDDVAPLSEEEVVRVMEQELRVPWEDVFASIEPSRSPPARSARCTARRSRAASTSSSRCSGRTRARRSPATSGCSSCSPRRRSSARRCAARSTSRRSCSTSRTRCAASSTSRRRLRTPSGCARCSRRTRGSACPRVHRDLSTSRLLVLEYVEGVGDRPLGGQPGAARGGAAAARGLLPADPRGRLLPRRPAPRQPALDRREDLPARPRHGRRARRPTSASS